MRKNYSDEFITVLSERLNEQSNKVDRTLCKELAKKRLSGTKLTYRDLDHNTLKKLCIYELCPDGLIAAVFDTDRDVVHALRDLYGYTDDIIPETYTRYITEKLVHELEEELGEKAYC